MDIYHKNPGYSGQKLIIFFIASGVLIAGVPIFGLFVPKTEADLASGDLVSVLNQGGPMLLGENTLIPVSSPSDPEPRVVRKLSVVVTAYSSSVWETDDSPHITAAGTWVRDGILANNFFPFGTRVRIPELYGDKIFIVEDRMNWQKGNYQIDIWFPSYWEALNFGAKRTYIEILES